MSAPLHTARLLLRPIAPGDAEHITTHLSNPRVARMLRLVPQPYTLAMAQEWIATHPREREEGTAFRFAICQTDDGSWMIGITDLDEIANGAGEIGYWLAEPVWGKGYATEAAAAVVKFAFTELGLKKLETGTAFDNAPSGHVLEKLGFRRCAENRRVWSKPRKAEIVQFRFELDRKDWLAQ